MNGQLRESIDWVGFIDWNTRDFHGYPIARGTTYNTYLVRDEKTALIDTVKASFAETLLEHLRARTDPARIDYVVVNHAEPDHAGSLPVIVAQCPHAEIVCNKKCRDILARHMDVGAWRFRIVADGERLSLGRRSLHFFDTPLVHWPESMATFVPEEKVLFSMDNFGQHYASSAHFDDSEPFDMVMEEAKSYYANIFMSYGASVRKALERVRALEPELIAPSHGVIWRRHVGEILNAYDAWTAGRMAAKALIFYDTMWGGTEEMARAIFEGALGEEGVETKLFHIRATNRAILATETLDAAAIAVGSSTLNRTLLPEVADVLTYLQGLRPPNKKGFVFGSYGWSKGADAEMTRYLQAMKCEIVREPLLAQYRPDAHNLEECRAAGRLLARAAAESASLAVGSEH